MLIPQHQSTLTLKHFGRKSAKVYEVTIWFVVIDGELWIGSLDDDKNWVKNLRAAGKARIDFGSGEEEVTVEFFDDAATTERHKAAVTEKYPFLSRVIGLFNLKKKRVAFRLTFA